MAADISFAAYTTILKENQKRSRGYMYDPVAVAFPRIFVGAGGQLSPRFMLLHNVTHVINCADDSACPRSVRPLLSPSRYTVLNAIDSPDVKLFEAWYEPFKKAMDAYLRDPTCRNVYVHCHAGINRSAFLAAGYIISTFRVPLSVCVSRLSSQRPCVMQNEAFQHQFYDFVKVRQDGRAKGQ